MATQIVFSDNLTAEGSNLTARFTNAVAFTIDLPDDDFEIEIDCYLQLYIPKDSEELVRNIPLTKIDSQVILLNKIDSQSIITIPQEYQNCGLEMAILLLSSENHYLDVYIIERDYNLPDLLLDIDSKLALILEQLSIEVETPATTEQQEFFLINF